MGQEKAEEAVAAASLPRPPSAARCTAPADRLPHPAAAASIAARSPIFPPRRGAPGPLRGRRARRPLPVASAPPGPPRSPLPAGPARAHPPSGECPPAPRPARRGRFVRAGRRRCPLAALRTLPLGAGGGTGRGPAAILPRDRAAPGPPPPLRGWRPGLCPPPRPGEGAVVVLSASGSRAAGGGERCWGCFGGWGRRSPDVTAFKQWGRNLAVQGSGTDPAPLRQTPRGLSSRSPPPSPPAPGTAGRGLHPSGAVSAAAGLSWLIFQPCSPPRQTPTPCAGNLRLCKQLEMLPRSVFAFFFFFSSCTGDAVASQTFTVTVGFK